LKLLLDTQLLLWAAGRPERLSTEACMAIGDPRNELLFSAASLWEVAIESMLGRQDLRVDPRLPRRCLFENGYGELAIVGSHAVAVVILPSLHRDPFDRGCLIPGWRV
jgi:PIN domain nuclease of toxin-antitoxin system